MCRCCFLEKKIILPKETNAELKKINNNEYCVPCFTVQSSHTTGPTVTTEDTSSLRTSRKPTISTALNLTGNLYINPDNKPLFLNLLKLESKPVHFDKKLTLQ